MFGGNSILRGIVIGASLPIVGFALFYGLFSILENIDIMDSEGMSTLFKERTSAIVGICFNMIPLNIFNKRRHRQVIRGLVFPTMLYVVLWLAVFGKYVI